MAEGSIIEVAKMLSRYYEIEGVVEKEVSERQKSWVSNNKYWSKRYDRTQTWCLCSISCKIYMEKMFVFRLLNL